MQVSIFLRTLIQLTIVFGFLLQTINAVPQATQNFKAFGVNPTKPNDSLFENIKNASTFKGKYQATFALIEFHRLRGNLDSIVFYGNKLFALTNKERLKNKEEYLSKTCNVIAEGKLEKGLYDEALKWYLEGLKYSTKKSSEVLYIKNSIGLGFVKYIRGKKSEGIAILEKSINEAPNQEVKHEALFKLGAVYYAEENLEKAKSFFKEAKLFYVSENLIKEQLETDLWLGKIAIKEKKDTEALNLCYEVFNESLRNNFFMLYVKSGNVIGNIYLQNKEYESAQKILSTVYINTIGWGNLEIERQVIFSLQKAHAQIGDYENAYALMTHYNRVSNDILVKQNKQQVNELEVEYKTLEQQQEITRQKTIKSSLLIGFLVVLIPVLALLYVYYQKLQTQSKLTKTLEEVNEQKITSLLKNQELKLVKASFEGQNKERKRIARELHDSIGGNLATIKLQLSNNTKQDKEVLIKQVDDTYNQVRELSHNLMPKKFKDSVFTSVISEYVNNINTLSKEEISIQIHPKEVVDTIKEEIKIELYKIIQELLTNALKHAKSSQIEIQLSVFNNNIKLLFEDDGVGFNKEKVKYGLGFQNLKDRLKTIKGNILINSFPNRGTVIDIDVPLN